MQKADAAGTRQQNNQFGSEYCHGGVSREHKKPMTRN